MQMMNKFIAYFVLAIVLISCGDNNTAADYIDSSLHMRPPDPVVVESPSSTSKLKLPPGTCIIVIRDQDWLFVIDNDTTVCNTSEEFHVAIKDKSPCTLNGNLALQTDSKATGRINETIALLKQDSIVRFNLATDLHDSIR